MGGSKKITDSVIFLKPELEALEFEIPALIGETRSYVDTRLAENSPDKPFYEQKMQGYRSDWEYIRYVLRNTI